MALAKTLDEARKLLDPRPLDFSASHHQGGKVATDPSFYAELPRQQEGGLKQPGPMEKLRRQLLASLPETKLFLSGHVGSGKSTELSRLAANPEIVEKFHVTMLKFEEHEWATLDSTQVRFRVAAALYEAHKEKLRQGKGARWESILQEINRAIFQPMGIQATDGSLALEFDLVFVKLKQDLKLSDKARQQFRAYGETKSSLLQDFVRELVGTIESALAKEDGPVELLMIIDDLDKVRQPEQQRDIFETNLNAILALPLRILLTLPTGILFAGSRVDVRSNVVHLYPVRVLHKAPEEFDPEKAPHNDFFDFFVRMVHQRVQPDLIHPEAIRLAAIHSGGVLREFFRLLREGVNLATFNDMSRLETVAMRAALKDIRLTESIGLYGPDYDVLVSVHRTNELPQAEDRRLLDLTRVIECYNGSVWFEANPLLWPLIQEHIKKSRHAQPPPILPASSG